MSETIRRQPPGRSSKTQAQTTGLPNSVRVYTALINLVGLAALAHCSFQFASRPEVNWFGLAVLTAITSCLAVRIPIPGGRAGGLAITVNDCFVMIALLLYRPEAAALTAAIDGLVTGIRCRIKRPERLAFNVAVMTLDAYLVASLFNVLTGTVPPVTSLLRAGVLPALGIVVVVYFLLNSLSIAFAMSLATGQRFSQVWKANFPWASPSLLSSTLAAMLFILGFQQTGAAVMAAMLGLGVVCLGLSALCLIKGRRLLLNSRLAQSA